MEEITSTVKVKVVTLSGKSETIEMPALSTVRECLEQEGLGQEENAFLLVFHNGRQILPDLTVLALGIRSDDILSVYNRKNKRHSFPIPLYSDLLYRNDDSFTAATEAQKMFDRTMVTLENGRESKAFIRSILLRQKQADDELDDDYDIFQDITILSKSSKIQTLPLPPCFEFESSEIGREFSIPSSSLSPLNPLRRNPTIRDASQTQ